ncbi:MAG: hypothetical protein J3Q66DRAFT_354571 [Benniella sp.]|nr:MAG: hypothetical protein J3Q66DRAFT_354571 [Benniella sp.]
METKFVTVGSTVKYISPCGQRYLFKGLTSHLKSGCESCRSNKKRKAEVPSVDVPEVLSESVAAPAVRVGDVIRGFTEDGRAFMISVTQVVSSTGGESVVTAAIAPVKETSSSESVATAAPTSTNESPAHIEDEWPAFVDRETHVEWNDDLAIPNLLDGWDTPGCCLQQTWASLLVDVVLVNPTKAGQGLVVETYCRNQDHDCFAERTDRKAAPDQSAEGHMYKHVKVCSRPTSYGSSCIVLGTKAMNALFPLMLLKTKDSVDVDNGQCAGGGFSPPLQSTRVFLSKMSIEAARQHKGARFPEDGLPSLAQLRGVFSHFHLVATYFSARMSRLPKEQMPVTVFTLGDTKCADKYKAVGSLLEDIACGPKQSGHQKGQGGGNQGTRLWR